jgi:hypothetical protein
MCNSPLPFQSVADGILEGATFMMTGSLDQPMLLETLLVIDLASQ